eukprot:g5048.t1
MGNLCTGGDVKVSPDAADYGCSSRAIFVGLRGSGKSTVVDWVRRWDERAAAVQNGDETMEVVGKGHPTPPLGTAATEAHFRLRSAPVLLVDTGRSGSGTRGFGYDYSIEALAKADLLVYVVDVTDVCRGELAFAHFKSVAERLRVARPGARIVLLGNVRQGKLLDGEITDTGRVDVGVDIESWTSQVRCLSNGVVLLCETFATPSDIAGLLDAIAKTAVK